MKKRTLCLVPVLLLLFCFAASCAGKADTEELFTQAFAYYNGDDVEQDYKEAAKLFNIAAKRGDADSQLQLGYMYYMGKGVEQNYDKAVELFRQAAEQGSAAAQYNLGLLYESGEGVGQDIEEADKWFSLAAEQGCEEALDHYQSASAVEDENTLEWAKSHSTDGTMFIYTSYYTLGTWMDPSDQQLDIYGCIYQNKDCFFLTLCDEQGNLVPNDGNTDLILDAELVWDEGTEKEFRQGFDADMPASDYIVRLSGSARGYVQGCFASDVRRDVVLILYFPNGSVYRFPIPQNTNYKEVWEKVSDFWYIPTYNDDIYEGSGVNPDLVDFLTRFETVFNAEIEKRRQADVLPLLIEDLLGVNAPNEELTAMYAKYQEMETGLYRLVDAEYYAECRARVEQTLWEITIDHSSKLGHELSDVFEEFGYDDIAEISEIAAEVLELLR